MLDLQKMLLESCAVGYNGKTDDAWERTTLVHDVFNSDARLSAEGGDPTRAGER